MDISLDKAFIENDKSAILIKISNEFLEVNIYLPLKELDVFYSFVDGDLMRIQAGALAGSCVHWLRDEEDIYILIGIDEQAWDVSLIVDQNFLDELKIGLKRMGVNH